MVRKLPFDGATSATEAAQELLADVREQATVLAAMAPQQPDVLLAALIAVARARRLVLTLLVADLSGRFAFLDEEAGADLRSGRLRVVSLAGGVPRAFSAAVDYVTNSLWDIDRMLGSGALAFDVLVARVSAAEDQRTVAFGDMVGYTPSALERGAVVGFEVALGRVFAGTETLALDRADVHYRAEPAPRSVRPARAVEAEGAEIARLVVGLVPDEATLQLGLGAVPEAVIGALGGKRDLGLHSGILHASVRSILGTVVTGSRKSSEARLHVATGVLDDDPSQPASRWGAGIRLEPVAITHAPHLLARHERLWAINSAFEIDLAAQINAEFAGGLRVASGGGQTDFVRAAHASPGGASVIALRSRAKDGTPRLVPRLSHPHVTSTGAELDFVVTEHGVAELRGATAAERAARLIEIAHPGDRDALTRAWSSRVNPR